MERMRGMAFPDLALWGPRGELAGIGKAHPNKSKSLTSGRSPPLTVVTKIKQGSVFASNIQDSPSISDASIYIEA